MGISTTPTRLWKLLSLPPPALLWIWLIVDQPYPILVPTEGSSLHPLFPISRLAGATAFLLIQMVLVWLYDRQEFRTPRLAFAAYVLASIGTELLAGALFYQALLGQAITTSQEPLPAAASGLIVAWGIVFAVGYVLFGVVVIGTNQAMRIPALFIIIGAPFVALSGAWQFLPQVATLIAATLLAVGLTWMVYRPKTKPV